MAKVLARHTFRQRIIGYLVSHCNKKWLKSKLFRFKPFQPHPTRTLFCLQLASVRRPIRRFVKSQHRKWFRQSVTLSCMEVEIIARKCSSRCCNRRWAMSTTCCMISWSRCDLCHFLHCHIGIIWRHWSSSRTIMIWRSYLASWCQYWPMRSTSLSFTHYG